MSDDWGRERSVEFLTFLHSSQTLCQVFACTIHPCRHFDEGNNVLLKVLCISAQTIHSIDKDINALVAPFVASACRDDDCVVFNLVARECTCYVKQTLAGCGTLLVECLALWHEVVFEAIRQHYVHRLVHKLLAFCGCYIAHGCEAVYVERCLLLNRVFALHVQLGSHLVAVICLKVFVERLVVAGNTASDTCSMCGEDGRNLRHAVVDVECAQTSHPLVSMINNLSLLLSFRLADFAGIETLHNKTRCVREHRSLVVVAVCVKAVNVVLLPKLTVYHVLLSIILIEVDEYGYRIARHRPSAYLYFQAFFLCLLSPRSEEFVVFDEIRTCFFTPTVGTNKDEFVTKLLYKRLGSCRKHCINASYLIANFPTRFKNVVWK